jgi:hypothetical protein
MTLVHMVWVNPQATKPITEQFSARATLGTATPAHKLARWRKVRQGNRILASGAALSFGFFASKLAPTGVGQAWVVIKVRVAGQ